MPGTNATKPANCLLPMLTLAKAAKRLSLQDLTNTPTVLKPLPANGTPANLLPGLLPTPTRSFTYYRKIFSPGLALAPSPQLQLPRYSRSCAESRNAAQLIPLAKRY